MKSNFLRLAGVLALFLYVSCVAADGCSRSNTCNGIVEYVELWANKNHTFSLDVNFSELEKLPCQLTGDRYFTISNTIAKKEFLTAILSSYMGKRRVLVTVNPDSNPCEVAMVFLYPKGS